MWEREERIKESETSNRYTWYIFMERQFHELDFSKISVLRAMVVKGFFLLEDDTILSATCQRL